MLNLLMHATEMCAKWQGEGEWMNEIRWEAFNFQH
jgi:hypothetical protein